MWYTTVLPEELLLEEDELELELLEEEELLLELELDEDELEEELLLELEELEEESLIEELEELLELELEEEDELDEELLELEEEELEELEELLLDIEEELEEEELLLELEEELLLVPVAPEPLGSTTGLGFSPPGVPGSVNALFCVGMLSKLKFFIPHPVTANEVATHSPMAILWLVIEAISQTYPGRPSVYSLAN